MSAQPSPQAFTKQDARKARQSYQHVAAVVNRLLSRVMQQLDEETAKRFFKPIVFHTVHALHAFFHGQDLGRKGGELMKSHQFVAPFFDYYGDPKNAAKFVGSRLDALAAAEMACGRRFVEIQRADGRTLLYTWYKAHPLLDAAEWAYHQARQREDYWTCAGGARAAVTDDVLDAAIEMLPVVETPAVEAEADEEGDEDRERWDAADLMNEQVVKGMWTKVLNGAERALVKEFDTGGDPLLAAHKAAAKIIDMGKAVKERLARERLRVSVREPDDIADSPGRRDGPSTEEILAEVLAPATHTTPSVVDTVMPSHAEAPEGDPREFSLGSDAEPVENQQFDSQGLDADAARLLKNALDYAAAGIAVLPLWGVSDGICDCRDGSECRTPGKHPHSQLARKWEKGAALRGVHAAVCAEKVIRSWFRKDARINLGVAMGGALNLVCVDIDPRNEGDATYFDLVEAHGEDAFPETFTVKTGGGGWHRYYRLPEAIKPKKGELKGELGPGVDIKGAGGLVVAPGSRHSSGNFYEVEANVYIAEAAPWMVDELLKARDGQKAPNVVDFQAHRTRKREGMSGSAIVEGERNKRLFRIGCALWGKGEVTCHGELLSNLVDINTERVSPPLDFEEVSKIAESISGRYAPGVPIPEGAA